MGTEAPHVTVSGRLSFPAFTAQQAYDKSQNGKFKYKNVEEAKPNFDILLDQVNLDKVKAAIEEQIAFAEERAKAGEQKNRLETSDADDMRAGLASNTWKSKLYQLPLKEIHEKTAPLAPEAVAALGVKGMAGTNLELRAIVQSEDEVTDPNYVFTKPAILPIKDTVHDLYAGCNIKVTVNFYAYETSGTPGISCGASIVVFHRDNDRFGGGVALDEDEMFLDD